ncbi:hypothetical protein [Breoghania sp.]|uniref:hypothetical protein n=1 Tax=Breoghania sp. TaxID=2065378 RepID=UPI0039F0A5B0
MDGKSDFLRHVLLEKYGMALIGLSMSQLTGSGSSWPWCSLLTERPWDDHAGRAQCGGEKQDEWGCVRFRIAITIGSFASRLHVEGECHVSEGIGDRMYLTIVAPFRTLLNLDSDLAFADSAEFVDLSKCALSRFAAKRDVARCESRVPVADTTYTRYRSLDEDSDTWNSAPVVKFEIGQGDTTEMWTELRGTSPDFAFINGLCGLTLFLFDNTVGVFVVTVDAADQAEDGSRIPGDTLERRLTDYAAQLTGLLQKRYVEGYIRELLAVEKERGGRRRARFVRSPNEFLAFEDLRDHPYPQWNSEKPSLFWVHRVLELFRPDARAHCAPMIRQPDLYDHAEGEKFLTCAGTSYVFDESVFGKYIKAQVYGQYFAGMFEAIRVSQTRLFRNLLNVNKKVKIGEETGHLDRLESKIALLESDLHEFVDGLQNESARAFAGIEQQFGLFWMLEAMTKRNRLLHQRLRSLTEARNRLRGKFLSFILVTLGGVQLLDLIVSIWSYGVSREGSGIIGLTSLARVVPIDIALNTALACLLIAAASWVWWRGRP